MNQWVLLFADKKRRRSELVNKEKIELKPIKSESCEYGEIVVGIFYTPLIGLFHSRLSTHNRCGNSNERLSILGKLMTIQYYILWVHSSDEYWPPSIELKLRS